MFVSIVTISVYGACAYLALGAVATLALHARGLRILDHATAGAPISFRVLVTPGLIALWPIMLCKWRKAARGGDGAGRPDAPIPALRLRQIHGIAIRLLALLIPVAVGAAVMVRAPVAVIGGANPLTDAPPLRDVALERSHAFEGFPIVLRVRTDDLGSWQVELDAERELDTPALGLYWLDGPGESIVPGTGVYLGNVWGPGARRFAVDGERLSKGGSLVLYSFADAEVVARASVKAPS
ncbi:MAG: hypothetical protein HUU46_14660 [Candidatus Hydrogenedentes bacterium]|nr:hypothetical protein [Candidatus Hydrogenedentota bacterium]